MVTVIGVYSMEPVHPLTPEAAKYVAAMTVEQRKLHELAIEKLGSSYFVERTRGFEEYMKRLTK